MARLPTVTPDGDRIREFRGDQTREEVVARMRPGRHPKALHMLECGAKTRASRRYMEELAKALGAPVDDLIKKAAA